MSAASLGVLLLEVCGRSAEAGHGQPASHDQPGTSARPACQVRYVRTSSSMSAAKLWKGSGGFNAAWDPWPTLLGLAPLIGEGVPAASDPFITESPNASHQLTQHRSMARRARVSTWSPGLSWERHWFRSRPSLVNQRRQQEHRHLPRPEAVPGLPCPVPRRVRY